jgi:hypothetical protein
MQTSMMTGVFGRPIRRESWETVICAGDGMRPSSFVRDLMDAIFGLSPHGAVAGPMTHMMILATKSQHSQSFVADIIEAQ